MMAIPSLLVESIQLVDWINWKFPHAHDVRDSNTNTKAVLRSVSRPRPPHVNIHQAGGADR